MKNFFLMAAVAAATLTSCSKSETIEQPKARAIQFANTVVSRAATALNSGEFNIVGYRDLAGTPTFVFESNEIYSLNYDKYKRGNTGTADTWTGMYYYDGLSTYTFYGYAKTLGTTTYDAIAPANTLATGFAADPANAVATLSAGSEKITFTTPDNNNVDFVTMGMTVLPAAHSTAQDTVVTFMHALTRIRFTAFTDMPDAQMPIAITGITFTTAKNAGEVTWSNMASGTMSATGSTPATFSITGSNFPAALTATAATPATTGNHVFYVVPQQLRDGDLVVAYTIGGVATSKSFDLSSITMASGQSYNFNIKINLNKITFNAELENWSENTQAL